MKKFATLLAADAAFKKTLGAFRAHESKTAAMANGAINALADVVATATEAGLPVKAIWDHAGTLLDGEEKDILTRWRYAAFGIARGLSPQLKENGKMETLKEFAARCGKPEGLSKQGGSGTKREVGATSAARAKSLKSASTKAGDAYASLVTGKASKALLDQCAALITAIDKAAAAEQAAADGEKATK